MFTGEFVHSFDEKGRVIIPSKFRNELGETFYIGKGLDKCLFVYPIETWNEFVGKLKNLSTFDKQGRILIPPTLREFSELNSEASIIGVIDRIEIWNKDSWNDYSNNDEFDFDSIAEKMSDLGIGL